MMGYIAEDTIREIRERTDIVTLVSSYLPLRRSGANHQGLCPFHGEKTPSFNVNATRQIFHCFGCGVGGNVFSFLMRMEGLTFPEAVRRLGEKVGIIVEDEAPSPAEEQRRQKCERLGRINEVACEFYHQVLLKEKEGAPGRHYLRQRGYDGETARTFRLGFAPGRWNALAEHLANKGFNLNETQELGLIRPGKDGRGDYDLFRNRLLFPILDLNERVAAFGGRVLDDSLPKYLNSPESSIYHKGRILYGLAQAREEMRKNDEVIVVEGYFDQLALHRAGFVNTVATCGTALTEDHGRLLQRYAKKILLLFDQDQAGRKATLRGMEVLLPLGLSVATVDLDAGEDPDSFLRKRGAEAFIERLQNARPVLEAYMETVLQTHGDNIEGRARAAEEIVTRLKLVPSEIERSLYLQNLAARTGLARELLQEKIAYPAPGRQPRAAEPWQPQPQRRTLAASRELKAQDLLLRLMLEDGGVRREVAEEGVANLFFDNDRRMIAEQLIACDAKTETITDSLLFDRVNEEQKAVLSGILLKDEKAFAEERQRIVQDCRQTVFKEILKRRVSDLDEQIHQAELANDLPQLTTCRTERLQVCRELKKYK